MKNLLIAIALLSPIAQAEEFVIPNTGGGGIYISTDSTCKDKPGMFVVYARNKLGATIYGCWFLNQQSNLIMVEWNDGTSYTYPANAFVPVKPTKTGTPI